ncbi:MAG: adenylate/guanylate cyclase domain-containing protein [Chloroflexi bacterium]|nr:adenylate/guanylate cyclase domain-containing protein [Chloroflexota bacterium]
MIFYWKRLRYNPSRMTVDSSFREQLKPYLTQMRFPSALEQVFQDEYYAHALGIHRIAIWTAVVAYVIFHLLDLGGEPQVVTKLAVIRFGIFVPILLLLFACSYLSFYKRVFDWMTSAGIIVAGVGVMMVQVVVDRAGFPLFATSVILVILSGYTLARLRFVFASIAGWTLFVIHVSISIFVMRGNLLTVVMSAAFLALTNVIGMISAYYAERYMRRDFIQRLMLDEERYRSENLLLNILPPPVAERLKRGELVADSFESASVLFADIVDFTPWSSSRPPEEVLAKLNVVFSRFDSLADKYSLEKIKTIGDAYMVVSGVPLPRADHVRVIAEMALEMRSALAEIRDPDGQPFDIRIGIHCGPLVAGVVGSKKFIYDLWGDTVNIASRMESHGLPGRIQVSEAVYHCLREEYRFEERGPLTVKGRGEMTTYWLMGRRTT